MGADDDERGVIGYVPSAVTAAPLARLYSAGELLPAALLHQNVFPPLVQHLLYSLGHIDDLGCWDCIVVFLDVAVVHLVPPERVGGLAEFIHAGNLGFVFNGAFATQRV